MKIGMEHEQRHGKETGETNLLSDWDLPKPQSEPNSKPELDKLDIDKLHLEQDSPKEEWIEVNDSLIPLPTTSKEEEKATMEETIEEMMEAEKKYQQEEEKYTLQTICIGQLRKKKATPDQNILVTATLVKRERTFPKYELLNIII